MHIVHLSWEYPPVVYGGLGRHVHALSAAQAGLGHTVTVVTQQPPGAPAREQVDGVHVVRVPPDGPFPYHLPSLLPWVGTLDDRMGTAAVALPGVEVVHAHDWVTGRGAARASQLLGAPLVATIHATEAGRHSGWLPDDVSRAVHLLEQWLTDEADQIIVCSTSMQHEIGRAHATEPGRITVIPNGIDASRYRPVETVDPALLTGSPRISLVGRIEWEKGVFVAVAAMPQVLTRYPRARLRMVGTGGQARAVAELIAEQGLGDHIEMLGHVDEATLRAVYSSSDLAIAPSSYEPFGLVALEAAAMGTPLIVADTTGLAEFVTDDRGRRCRPNDPQSLAGQILAALDDPAGTRRRRDAATAALQQYTWPDIAGRTMRVYRRAVRRPRPPRMVRAPANPVWG